MWRVNVDKFSGRLNPTWIATYETTVRRVMDAAAENRVMVGRPREGFQGPGFWVVRVDTRFIFD